MERLFRRLIRGGLDRALGGEGWQWFAWVGAVMTLRRAYRKPPSLVARLPIRVGQRWLVALSDKPPRRSLDR
ncbi:MAG TPA: hypothetical protein VKG43_06320 [Acidimicrobiales bacterium]|nr:hypothetical protein [Acidimicrobiales bacterium]